MAASDTGPILILGGTEEARKLANRLDGQRIHYSLAGRTERPFLPNTEIRIGGFGGIDGLTRYLREQAIKTVINATHPFAARMSAHALAACSDVGVPLFRLLRPAWQARSGDHWHCAADIASLACQASGRGERLFAAIGAQGAQVFLQQEWRALCFIRSSEPPLETLPRGIAWIQDRGPFPYARERETLSITRATALLCRNSGGQASYAKIEAARQAGLYVYMLERPAYAGPSVSSIEEVLDRLRKI
ncbi:MAG TPA: cobalt-precorrin-6A reductase [Dongiaceae bacterium]|nr:cobalt-precorrin-6A reductase [Dongiaceae bacterium]